MVENTFKSLFVPFNFKFPLVLLCVQLFLSFYWGPTLFSVALQVSQESSSAPPSVEHIRLHWFYVCQAFPFSTKPGLEGGI